ncbi:MAG TPA: hypothetical protein VFB07_12250 [Vicinamibacterales bacterium]|nr:hypothetical protein [Vicinamibacterales bacterium]
MTFRPPAPRLFIRPRWLSALAALLASAVVAGAPPPRPQVDPWAPPIGIPAPSFGIFETAKPAPHPWTTDTSGFYYVDPAKPGATDDRNELGTPQRPRRTIPTLLPAGAVVEVYGPYDASHSSPRTITARGTKAAPVFIRGGGAGRTAVRNNWEVRGSYVILENLEFSPLNDTQTGGLALISPGDHLAIRHSELRGNVNGGGLGIESWAPGTSISDVVVYHDFVHDNGNVNATFDQDTHGIHVGGRASRVWVVDSEMARNSGDGIQINAGNRAAQPATHHIYVGRNISHDNKQTGFWAKQATDVVFSQNLCYGHRTGNSSYGQCMGYQYATEWVWFLFNHIEDSDSGIAVSSDSDLGLGTRAFFVGNVIHNIHPGPAQPFNPNTAWSSAAIMLAGGVDRWVVNNTIYDVDAGINVPAPNGTLEVADTIIAKVTRPQAAHVFIEMGSLAGHAKIHHDLFEPEAEVKIAGPLTRLGAKLLATISSRRGPAGLADPDHEDFHLQPSSPAVGAGEVNGVYGVFQGRYGLNIATDPDGTSRIPQRGATDIGAYVAGQPPPCTKTSAPSAPGGLTVALPGRGLLLAWKKPACGVAASYVLEAAAGAGQPSVTRRPTGSAATTFTAPVAPPGHYFIRVRAQNIWGLSAASNDVEVNVPGR